MCVSVCVYVCMMQLVAAPPDSNRVMETRWGQGTYTSVLQVNGMCKSCVHNIHAEWGAMVHPGLRSLDP